jgi:hypothetical protein
MANQGTVEVLMTEVGKALLPLREAISSPQQFFNFMLKLGWQADDIPQPIQDIGFGVDTLLTELRKVVGEGLSIDGSVGMDSAGGFASTSISMEDIMRIKNAIQQIVDGVQAIATSPDAAFPPILLSDDFKNKFPKQAVSYLVIQYLTKFHPQWAFAFKALGIIKTSYVTPVGNRKPYIEYTIDFSDLPRVITDPQIVLENAFSWGHDDFDYGEFVSQLDNLFMSIGVDVTKAILPTEIATKIEGGVDLPDNPTRKFLKAGFFDRARDTGNLSADIRLLYLPKNGTKEPGIAIMPAFSGILDFTMQLSPDLTATIHSNVDLQGGVAVLIRPSEIDMVLGFNNPGAPIFASGSLGVNIERSNLDNSPTIIFGTADATRLEYLKIGGTAGVSLNSDNKIDFFVEFEMKGLKFVFKPGEADGFIRQIVPSDGVSLGFDLALGFSHKNGFYFRGSTTFELHIPTHIDIGPIGLDGLTLSFVPQDGKLPFNAGATIRANLGPMKAVVENMGMTATLSFPETGGNLGFSNIDLGFKPPNGVGLSIDAGAVKGGGYLFLDYDKGEYAGALELTISGFISAKAIGLITTKMPDGSDGFSLLIIITAEFNPPFQLGYGFTLMAVGGLLGLNRTMLLEPLREGVRTGSINSIMFPQNVVENAPRIISDLKAVFPPKEGTFLIGPMGKLGWGTPTLISLSFGLIIEIPGNIAILGVLKIVLPDEDETLIKIQVNFVGTLDFDKKMLAFDASLFDSRILFMTLEGDMAVRLKWGDNPDFILTVGGFHPSYTPPPLALPTLRRLSISILNEDWGRIRVECYQAVTSNTVQFGAAAELYFGFSSISIEGHIAFDALFQFSPFYFIVQISASVSLKAFGVGVFSIRLQFSLEGTSPWRAKGSGSISLLFFDISADFDVTWGESKDTSLPDIEVLPKLLDEFNKREQWNALLPQNNNLLVSLRKLNETTDGLVLHPVGTLVVSQKLLPLDLTIDKVGNQKPSDLKTVSIVSAKSDTTNLVVNPFEDSFARAQYQNLSDADKLSKPSFEKMHSGVQISMGGSSVRTSKMVRKIVEYEIIIVDKEPTKPLEFGLFFKQLFVLFNHFLKGNSVAKSTLSKATKQKLQPFDEKISVTDGGFAVVFNSDNTLLNPTARFSSEAMAQDFMQSHIKENSNLKGQLQVVPDFELVA